MIKLLADRKRIIRQAGLVTLIVAALVLLGWVIDSEPLKCIFPQLASMKVNTAICFALTGFSLWCLANEKKAGIEITRYVLLFLLAIAGTTLVEYLFKLNLGLDEIFTIDTGALRHGYPFPGRMASASAVCFLLMGLGLLAINSRIRAFRIFAQYSFQVVTIIAIVALIGYLMNVPAFYRISYLTSMSLHTSALFFVVSIAGSMLNPVAGWAKLFSGTEAGSIMNRRLFPQLTIVVVILSFLRIQSHRFDLIGVEFGISLSALSFLIASLFLVRKTADVLNVLDKKRKEAESELHMLNEQLEQKVAERSKELGIASERLILATNAAGVGVWDWDIATNLLVWDDQMLNLYGCTKESFDGTHDAWKSRIHPDDLERVEEELTTALNGGKSFDTNYRIFAKNQAIHYIKAMAVVQSDADGQPMRMVGTNWDVTRQRTSELKFRGILESAPDPTVIVNQLGKIELINAQAEKVFGYAKEDLMGSPVEMLMPDKHKGTHSAHRQQYYKSAINRSMGSGLELYAIKKDGSEFPVEISLSPLETAEGLWVTAAIRDVTERKKAQTELIESNRRNTIFVDQAPNAIAMFDLDMKYLAASSLWLKDYGLEGKELLGQSHYEIFPEIGEDWKKIHQECLAGAVNQNEEAYFLRSDGTEQWLAWDVRPWYIAPGKIGGILMYTADVTERKMAQQQLRMRDEQFKGAFEHSANGMAVISLEGKWQRVNKKISEILGYTGAELMQLTFQDITHPDDLDLDLQYVA